MKRRIFVRNTALAGLGVGALGFGACSGGSKKEKNGDNKEGGNVIEPFFKLSLAQWSIHRMIQQEGMNPFEFASKAKEWGFEGLEYVNHLYSEDFLKNTSVSPGIENVVKELNLRAEDTGMKNLIMMVDLPPGEGDMAVTDDVKRTKAMEMHHPRVEATSAPGCLSMRVNMFGAFEKTDWKAASVDALGRLGEHAQQYDINVLVENHGWLTSDAALLMEVINEVGLNNVGTLPDFGNFCIKRKDKERWGACVETYDKYKGIEELMPAAKAVSAKSYDFDQEGKETTIDYARMVKIVKEAGYTGYIGVEYEGQNLSEEEGILATKDLLIASAKEVGQKEMTASI